MHPTKQRSVGSWRTKLSGLVTVKWSYSALVTDLLWWMCFSSLEWFCWKTTAQSSGLTIELRSHRPIQGDKYSQGWISRWWWGVPKRWHIIVEGHKSQEEEGCSNTHTKSLLNTLKAFTGLLKSKEFCGSEDRNNCPVSVSSLVLLTNKDDSLADGWWNELS